MVAATQPLHVTTASESVAPSAAAQPESVPIARRYKFRANAKCGRKETGGPGAFAHDHIVYEGDEFFLTLHPVRVKVRDKSGNAVLDENGEEKRVLREQKLPTWADPIAEYLLEVPVKPIRVIAGAAPVAPNP